MATQAIDKMALIHRIEEEFYKKYGVIKNERMFSIEEGTGFIVFLFDFTVLGEKSLDQLRSDKNKYIEELCEIDKNYTNKKTFNRESSIAENTRLLDVVVQRVEQRIRKESAAWDEAEKVLVQKNIIARRAYEEQELAAGRQIIFGGGWKKPQLWPGPGSVHPSLLGGAGGGSGKKRKTRSRKNKRSRRRSTRKF
jgi:hypothetical protein